MASNPKLDTSSSSPDGVPYGSHRSNHSSTSNLERSGINRDGHDGRMLVLGAGGAGGAVNSSGAGAGSGSELPPLSQVLSLDALTLGDQRGSRHHLELKRAINAAIAPAIVEDPHLGSLQSKPLENCGPDELKRVRSSLVEHAKGARDRSRHFVEAIVKLDRFRNTLQSRKRSRPDPSSVSLSLPASAERSLSSLGVGERSVASVHNMKGNSNPPNSHGSGSDAGMQKGGDRNNKRVVPNKRVRTSMADTRPDGRPTNVNSQRPSVLSEREREVSRPSSSLTSPVEEKERAVAPPSDGWEKTKMKGRRSGTKPDASVASLANGTTEGDREHKWSGQQHRVNAESRSRPSEGHGFRSGPVHGITSVHKSSESSAAQFNGAPSRGTNKVERDAPYGRDMPEKSEPAQKVERPLKDHIKPPSREDSHPANPVGMAKAKGARAPRSGSSAGGVPPHLARNTSFGENRDRHGPPPKVQTQSPSAPTNRKRPPSPPTQWVGQRPQKMARRQRMNLMPGAALAREEPPSAASEGPVNRDSTGTNVGARSNPGMASGSGLARRVSVSGTHGHQQSKPKVGERVTTSVGLSESDESEDDVEKVKEKPKKQGEWEQKPIPISTGQKMGSVVAPAKKTRVVAKEEGGDGVRRQGRSGRGAVGPRTSVVNPVLEKVEVSANAKQLRSVRVGLEKHDRPGRPPTKKDTAGDRKPLTRPRRPIGIGVSEVSGESDDDREELVNAVNKAINASGAACPNHFWKSMEPYFAHLSSSDIQALHQLSKDLGEGDPALQIPACGDPVGKTEVLRNSTPPLSPGGDSGAGRSLSTANGNNESDGVVTKLFNNFKDKQDAGKVARKGVSGQWLDKILPLSQRLLAALINQGDIDEENCHDDSIYAARDHSPLGPGSTSESDRLDGDSDGETGRHDSDRWNIAGREGLPNGHNSRFGANLREDLGGEDEDILWMPDDSIGPSVKQETGDDGISGSYKDDQRGTKSSGSSANMTAWELTYQRMSVDDRIILELQTVGINLEPMTDLAQREDDEVSEEIRKLQRNLNEQVNMNKHRVHTLEQKILAKKEKEEKERERLAVNKLVEIAYSKRMGTRGSSGGKSSASKGAKAASLALVKRLLARVRAYEAGKRCFDDALKDLLFGVAPREIESTTAVSALNEGIPPASIPTPTSLNVEPAVPTSIMQLPKATAAVSSEGPGGRSVVRKTEVKSEKDTTTEVRQHAIAATSERNRGKDEGWPLRAKEREVLLEDVVGGAGMRDVNALGANVLGGTKGKRSERERDGKGHGKESHTRSDSAKPVQQAGNINLKPERKTKTKPRQKTAPLSKAVNGLLAKPGAESSKDRPVVTSSAQHFVGQVKPKEEVPAIAPPPASHNIAPDAEEVVDLSNIPLPGIEDLGVNDLSGQGPDLGSWLTEFDEDANLHDGDYLTGLEVPMDDLSDLGMML